MELGILSLSDIQTDPGTGRPFPAVQRIGQIIGYAELAERLGLDLFALGEHHTHAFAVSSPAVVLAAIAARTESIRLTSAVTVLSVLDPVRVYQDFAALDLVSHGRAEIIAGRSAFTEPFAIFGESLADYDALFTEKLDLLLRLREREYVTLVRPVPGPAAERTHRAPRVPAAAAGVGRRRRLTRERRTGRPPRPPHGPRLYRRAARARPEDGRRLPGRGRARRASREAARRDLHPLLRRGHGRSRP
jgi:alkanesulfonate monooxygenase SsuD/methylene tetrahydromethanopterin reductase-like flavin-dependent oxidoreductase (luciferase family)